MNHVNLVILTPGHSMMNSYVKSLLATTRMLDEKGISWAFSNDYCSHVADAREMTLSGTRTNDIFETRPFGGNLTYDKMLWIDSDIAWEPQDVLKLYESDKDIVSGAYILGDGSVASYRKMLSGPMSFEEVSNLTELTEVDGAGFGFICFKSGIFENLSRPWFQSVTHPYVIDGIEHIIPIMGEDLSLCARVKKIGYKIWLDPTVRLVHHKVSKLTWNGVMP